MPRFLLDTDHLTLLERSHPLVMQRVKAQAAGDVAVSAVTVEEALRGRLSYLASHAISSARVQGYALLIGTVRLLNALSIVPFDQASDTEYQQLRSQKLRVGSQDLKIAAVALVNGLTLLTRNRRDFSRVPGLVLDDWSV
jgi:tRNA(fMet)-specific endonuclease VapC